MTPWPTRDRKTVLFDVTTQSARTIRLIGASEKSLHAGQVGLPDHGPHAIKLLVEARGLTLEMLRAAVLEELDQDQ